MCDKAVEDDSSSLQYVTDWFVKDQQIDIWYDDYYWHHSDDNDEDKFFEWYEGYKNARLKKQK